jgi:nucleolar protein 56
MKCFVATLPFAVVAFDGEKVIERRFFKSPEEAAKVVYSVMKGEMQAIEDFLNILREKGYEPEMAKEDEINFLREKYREIAKDKFNRKELNEFLNRFSIELTKLRISALPRRDRLIIQVVSAIQDLDKIANLMSERLREWYGLHYPELEIEDHEKYARTIAEKGRRENFEGFSFSIGMKFDERDEEAVKKFARNLAEIYKLRESLNKYLEKLVKEEMPNLYALLGHVIAARLLAAAGSLEKLAKMPASTIQLLGAEKALFRFLRSKGKTKPPKHGIIFLTPWIANAPKSKRGKIARLLAAKLMLAARMDYYTKENKGEELRKDLEEKVKEVLKE